MNNYDTKFLTHQNAAALNRNMVLRYIRDNAPVSRTGIWKNIELSKASVTQIIKQFIDQGFVYEIGKVTSLNGRKQCYLGFNPRACYSLVFDWVLKTLFLADLNSTIIASQALSLTNKTSPADFVKMLSKSISELLCTNNIDLQTIIGCSLVMPGLINSETGVIVLSIEQSWKNVLLANMIEEQIGIRTMIEADANMLALGEYSFGIGKDSYVFVLINVDTERTGAAIILNGQLQRGSNFMIGEIGHITYDKNGPVCSCGKKGCIEACIKEFAKKETPDWQRKLEECISQLVTIIISLLDPHTIVLSGDIIEMCEDRMIDDIKQLVMEDIPKIEARNVQISKSTLGALARVKGACELLFERHFMTLQEIPG